MTWWSRARRRPGKPHWPVKPCVTLDPFYGAGTVGVVAQDMHLDCIGIEMSEEYAALARKRTEQGVLPFGGAA